MKNGTEYEVGRGKPPAHSQFKKGQSGNPAGARKHRTRRKKEGLGARDIAIIVANEKVPVTIKGKRRLILMKEAMIRRIYHDYMEATPNVRARLLPQLIQMGAFDTAPELLQSREERVNEFINNLAAEAKARGFGE